MAVRGPSVAHVALYHQVPRGDAVHVACEHGLGIGVHAGQGDHSGDDDVADLGFDVGPGVRVPFAGVLPHGSDHRLGDLSRLLLDLEELEQDALLARKGRVVFQPAGKVGDRLPGIRHARLASVEGMTLGR